MVLRILRVLRVRQSLHWYGQEIGVPPPRIRVMCQNEGGLVLGRHDHLGTGYLRIMERFDGFFPELKISQTLNFPRDV